jgi:hypothetical protein
MQPIVLNNKELKKFGIIFSLGLISLFGLLIPLLKGNEIPASPWLAGMLLLVPTFLHPSSLKFIYIPWMKLGAVLGWINTRIILSIIYFGLITPIGFILRCVGKDAMQRSFDKKMLSYRKISPPQSPQHMERPF